MTQLRNARAIVSPEFLLALQPFIALPEERRHWLQAIFIEAHPDGGAVLVASDGRRLAIVYDPAAYTEGPPQMWKLDWKKRLTSPMREIAKDHPAWSSTSAWCDLTWSETDGTMVRLVAAKSDGEGIEAIRDGHGTEYFRQVDLHGRNSSMRVAGTYSDYLRVARSLEPANETPHLWVQAKFLEDAAKFATALQPGDKLAAVTLTQLSNTALLMRLRRNANAVLVSMGLTDTKTDSAIPPPADRGYPDWLTAMFNDTAELEAAEPLKEAA